MNKLIEIRNQEMMCRERALMDSERSEFGWRRQKSGDSALLMRLLFSFEKAVAQVSWVLLCKQHLTTAPAFKLPLR
jgi:hypothetical protein